MRVVITKQFSVISFPEYAATPARTYVRGGKASSEDTLMYMHAPPLG